MLFFVIVVVIGKVAKLGVPMSSVIDKNLIRFANMAKGLILDCGCGKGIWKEILESKGDIIGIDINRKYLKKSLYKNVVICSITHLPFRKKIFNFIWVCAVIEHVKDNCIEKIMKFGNHIVIVTPNKNSVLNLLNILLGRDSWFSNPKHIRAYKFEELRKYGYVYGCSCGLPKRSFWVKIVPMYFWILFPFLSHSFVLEITQKDINN